LLGALGVVLVYRITYLLTNKRTTALLAGLFACFSYYHLEVVAVYRGMDGNDISFEFYVLASMWAYAEYLQNRKINWAILIGIFAGCAVLNKWLTGLIIYAPWAFNILWNIRKVEYRKELFHIVISFLVSVIVFMPWQLYIFHAFPTEALYEYSYNLKHVAQVVEGHGGDSLYYYKNLPNYFSEVLWYLLPIGMIYIFFKKESNKLLSVALTANIVLVFVFFSFIAQTKMETYFMAVLPAGYILIAVVIDDIILFKPVHKYLYLPILLLSIILIFRIPEITIHHNPETADKLNRWKTKAYNTSIYKQLKQHIPADNKVVINCFSEENIDVMFYNINITAYSWCFNENTFVKYIQQPQMKVAVFNSHNEFGIPKYVYNYPNTYIINCIIK
jgi:4-amino-4-deoxy-L-arabinose transferase